MAAAEYGMHLPKFVLSLTFVTPLPHTHTHTRIHTSVPDLPTWRIIMCISWHFNESTCTIVVNLYQGFKVNAYSLIVLNSFLHIQNKPNIVVVKKQNCCFKVLIIINYHYLILLTHTDLIFPQNLALPVINECMYK